MPRPNFPVAFLHTALTELPCTIICDSTGEAAKLKESLKYRRRKSRYPPSIITVAGLILHITEPKAVTAKILEKQT